MGVVPALLARGAVPTLLADLSGRDLSGGAPCGPASPSATLLGVAHTRAPCSDYLSRLSRCVGRGRLATESAGPSGSASHPAILNFSNDRHHDCINSPAPINGGRRGAGAPLPAVEALGRGSRRPSRDSRARGSALDDPGISSKWWAGVELGAGDLDGGRAPVIARTRWETG